MTFQTLARLSANEQLDPRTDEQKLIDAVAAVNTAKARLDEITAKRGPVDERAFGIAERQWEDGQAELYRLVEDVWSVDPRELWKALA